MQICDRKNKAGFTLAEVLIALAITAVLLAAVAVAFNASAMNYQHNEQVFRTVSLARQALTRMTAQLRNAQAVDPNAPASECSLITADGQDITYSYDPDQQKLYLVTNDDTTDADYLICDEVTSMSFNKDIAVEDTVTYVQSVQVIMTVSMGKNDRTMAAAAVIRKNLSR